MATKEKMYTVWVKGRGRGPRKIKVKAKDKAEIQRTAKKWLETGAKISIGDDIPSSWGY